MSTSTTVRLGLIVAFLLGIVVLTLPQWRVQAASLVTGWAWSSTIGWVEVRLILDDDTLVGYAWSDNIGWIQFGGLSGFPGGVPVNDNARFVDNDLVGWARVCAGTVNGDCTGASRTDGWDGWIYLGDTGQGDGVRKNASNGLYGYAWGSSVVGWLRFYESAPPVSPGPSPLPPPTGCLSVGVPTPCQDDIRIRAGTATTLYWETANTVACTVWGTNGDGTWNALSETGGQVTSVIESPTRYTLTCEGEDGSMLTSSVIVNIVPAFQEI